MPSMRPQPAAPTPGAKRQSPAAPAPSPAPPEPGRDDEQDERARAGGFHESSYELKTGVDIIESDWPEDITIPGELGDH